MQRQPPRGLQAVSLESALVAGGFHARDGLLRSGRTERSWLYTGCHVAAARRGAPNTHLNVVNPAEKGRLEAVNALDHRLASASLRALACPQRSLVK